MRAHSRSTNVRGIVEEVLRKYDFQEWTLSFQLLSQVTVRVGGGSMCRSMWGLDMS